MIVNNKNNSPGKEQQPEGELTMHEIICKVYKALEQKGYNPINQLVGYILSEDPTYITNYNNARGLIRRVDRDKLLSELVKNYLGISE